MDCTGSVGGSSRSSMRSTGLSRKRCLATVFAVLGACGCAMSAQAQTYWSAATCGGSTNSYSWSAKCWNTTGSSDAATSGPPTSGAVDLVGTSANQPTIDYDVASTSLTTLDIDWTALNQAANALTVATETVGDTGGGVYTQTGGSDTATNLSLGNMGGSLGQYNLSGSGTTLSAGAETIGVSGAGNLSQMSGTNTITGPVGLTVGANAGDPTGGSYTLTSGSLTLTEGSENIGLNGIGSFSQSGGTNTVGGASGHGGLELGLLPGSSGTYSLSGGVLNAAYEEVATGGNGTFTQDGGTNVTQSLSLGSLGSPVVGTYILSAGTLKATVIEVYPGSTFQLTGGSVQFSQFLLNGGTVIATGNEVLDSPGEFGSYTFTQTGATSSNMVAGVLLLGDSSFVSGTYQLQGGTLTATAESIGNGATGEFLQSGNGTNNTVNGDLTLGAGIGPGLGNGDYTLSATSLAGVASSLSAQNEIIGDNAIGQFIQGPNTLNAVSGTLTVAQFSGAAASSYALQGGLLAANAIQINFGGTFTESVSTDGSGNPQKTTLSANSLQVNGGGAFNQTGGTAAVSGNTANAGTFTVANATFSTGSFTNTGNLTVSGANGLLQIGTCTVTCTGSFLQTLGATVLNGGKIDPATITITGGSFGGVGTVVAGTVSISGGTVNVGGSGPGALHISGNLAQSGGTLEFMIGPNGSGGFLESMLVMDPGNTTSISNTNVVFDFVNGADPLAFFDSGAFDSNTFFKESDGSTLSASALYAMLATDDYTAQSASYSVTSFSFDPVNGATALTEAPVPLPAAGWLFLSGLAGLTAIARRRGTLGRRCARRDPAGRGSGGLIWQSPAILRLSLAA